MGGLVDIPRHSAFTLQRHAPVDMETTLRDATGQHGGTRRLNPTNRAFTNRQGPTSVSARFSPRQRAHRLHGRRMRRVNTEVDLYQSCNYQAVGADLITAAVEISGGSPGIDRFRLIRMRFLLPSGHATQHPTIRRGRSAPIARYGDVTFFPRRHLCW